MSGVGAVLVDLYGWYRETEPMFGKLFSDRASVPELDLHDAGHRSPAGPARRRPGGRHFARGRRAERLKALIRLALDFWTWRRLSREGLDDEAAGDLMAAAVAAEQLRA